MTYNYFSLFHCVVSADSQHRIAAAAAKLT